MNLNVVISKGVPHPQDLQDRIFYDLVMIMTWYLGWGDFRAWQTFSKFLVNRTGLTKFWYLVSNMSKSPKKRQKRQLLTKIKGGSVISCLQPWYLGEKWPKGYRTTLENSYNHIYSPLENIDISVLVIFIIFKQFWPKR